MKSELSAVTRRDTNKLIASAIPQQSIISDAVSNQELKLYTKISVKKCKLSISPDRKGFKKIPKIQHRCSSSILPTKNQSLLVNVPFHDTKLVIRDVTRPIIGHAKPGGIASRSSISHSPSRSFSKKKLEKGRKHIKRSPLRSPTNSPMKDAFERHRREVAAFVKLKSSEINYFKVIVYSNASLLLRCTPTAFGQSYSTPPSTSVLPIMIFLSVLLHII